MRKGERRKQDILAAASELFLKKGYTATSIQDILDVLGCTKGSFYHHFQTKFEVLCELARALAEEAHRDYMKQVLHSPMLDTLNALLFHASLLEGRHLPLLRSRYTLQADYEGTALLAAMQDAVRQFFYPAFVSLLHSLREQDEASFTGEEDLALAFAAFQAGCAMLADHDSSPGLLRALRRQLEGALGLKAGCLVIINSAELAGLRGRIPPC